jgi:hypothetical protein
MVLSLATLDEGIVALITPNLGSSWIAISYLQAGPVFVTLFSFHTNFLASTFNRLGQHFTSTSAHPSSHE